MKLRLLTILYIVITILLSDKTVFAADKYALIELNGSVNPVIAEYIVNAIKKANQDNMQFVLMVMDTPGGLLNSMRDIIKAILDSEIPVIVYTYPKGAQAASAGGFIMIAAHIAAMSPGTEIGAMHPVSPFLNFSPDEKQSGVMEKKVLNDTVAYAKSLAEMRKRNINWVEKAVREAISSTNNEALRLGVIDIVANDINDLLAQIDGKKIKTKDSTVVLKTKNIQQQLYAMDWKEKILNYFADPQMVFFLFIIAVVGIGFELKNPGMIVPGVIGAIALFLFLLAIKVLPINFAGLTFIILAIILFILELKFTSYGLLTLAGIVSFVIGSMILFDSPLPGGQIPLTSIITVLAVLLLFIFVVVRAVIKVHTQKAVTGIEGMIGEKGIATADFTSRGTVEVHGELWTAITDEPLQKGDTVEVVKMEGMVVHVKKIQQ
ncbi:MAG: nodulation protein NfeD [Spirochaetes bacterium]|nr:nodulation protein NfeD [Spirochaetota bacterium]